MRWLRACAFVAAFALCEGRVMAQRAATPADATVFIRLAGSVHAELEEPGAAKQIVDLDRIEIGTGSGFVISPHGYVLTNEHVISNSELEMTDGPRKARITLKVASIEVCFSAGTAAARGEPSRCFNASVHSSDAALDLAVLFIVATDLPYVALGDSDAVRSGQPVDALGYPFGKQLEVGRIAAPDLVPEISTSTGTISAVRISDLGDRSALQINSTVNPGNSGGPLVDRDGYAVGVIRARVKGDAGIGFAIPINQAKDFLESRGLDALMPAPRLRLGPFQNLEGKGIGLRLPDRIADRSPFRARVESDPDASTIALRIDRAVSPWTAKQLEQALNGTETFERVAVEASDSQASTQAAGVRLVGRASGTAAGGNEPVRMQYGILQLGTERLIARYVGPADHLAYNESVLRESLQSLEGQRLISGDFGPVEKLEWSVDSGGQGLNLAMPAGWIVEPGAPSACARAPQATAAAAAYPPRDVTLALRAAAWTEANVDPQETAAACSTRRGSNGAASYSMTTEWLGVSYAIEGLFLRTSNRQVVQLEVISPVQKATQARALLAAWIEKASEP